MRRFGSAIWLSLAMAGLALPIAANAQVICASNNSPPPELPVYEQPPIPEPGYLWTPGYWAGGQSGYYWVPGTWVLPPAAGLLWTPGYWAWRDGIYTFSAGYWGPHVGFYGGVNYGFGYGGAGYEGGRWENGAFAYNRTVNNFGGVRITNVYEKTVVVNETRVSFNGGTGGTTVRPTPEQEAATHEKHVAAIPAQLQQERAASSDKALLASENHGRPAIAATAKPGEFTGKGVVAAREEKPNATVPPPAKPGGAAAVGPNPGAPKTLEKREPAGEGQAPVIGRIPPKTPNTEGKPPNPEARPLNTEAKPPNTAVKPPNPEARPLNTEAKPPNTAVKPPHPEARPLNTEAKPPLNSEVKPPNPQARLPNAGAKPPAPVQARPAVPRPQPPHVATAPRPHPAPGAPHPKPGPKDQKPPG